MSGAGYIPYEDRSHGEPFGFLYPADWKLREIPVRDGAEIFVVGPSNAAGTYVVSMTVRAALDAQQTPEEAASAFVSRYGAAFGGREVGRARGEVAGALAVEAEVVYWMPLPLKAAQPRQTWIRERSVFFRRGDYWYEAVYSAAEEQYAGWIEAFRTLVRTFWVGVAPEDGPFQAVVAAASPLADG